MHLKKSIIILFLFVSFLVNAQDDYLDVGGALRFNIHNKSWNNDQTDPQFTWDTWRINVDARKAGIDMSFEYRFYPADNSHFIHHGWVGYGFTDNLYMKLGVSQVPFGITKYASHSWWFQIPYYVGLEDDYDIGVKFDYAGIENLELNFAYFHQAEPQGTPNFAARYSYDITPSSEASLKETAQFNIRSVYHVLPQLELGASFQYGTNYNAVLEEGDPSLAYAFHAVSNIGNFNFKGEYIYYNYGARNNAGEIIDKLQMGAYGYNYNIASEASILVAGLAYSIDVDWGPISNLQPYVDYSVINKATEGYMPSEHLVPGVLISAGNIYTYVDYAMGKNNAWLGAWTNGLAEGAADASWESRFNINIGYYF